MSDAFPTPAPDSPQRPLFELPEPEVPSPGTSSPSLGRPRMKSPQRFQRRFIDACLDELIPWDSPVRAVWDMVDGADLSELEARIKAVEGGAGRDPIDPRILMALWLWATIEGVSHAREIERLTKRDNYYKWICGEVSVNRTSLSTFYTASPEILKRILVDYTAGLMNEGLVNLNRVSLDGMRVRANASKSSFRRDATLEELQQQAEEQVERLDREREAAGDHPAKNQKTRESDAADRARRIDAARKAIPELAKIREKRKKGDGPNARISTTDPDARVMKMANGGFNPAFNVQIATDNESHVIVGVDVNNCGGDMGLFTPMMVQIKEDFGKAPDLGIADGGFTSYDDIESSTKLGVTPVMPVREEDKKRKKGVDPFKPLPSDTAALAAWRTRMGTEEFQNIYKQRAATAELVNAHLRNRNLQQFTVRGLQKVKCVGYWYALAHNLTRALALRAKAAEKAI